MQSPFHVRSIHCVHTHTHSQSGSLSLSLVRSDPLAARGESCTAVTFEHRYSLVRSLTRCCTRTLVQEERDLLPFLFDRSIAERDSRPPVCSQAALLRERERERERGSRLKREAARLSLREANCARHSALRMSAAVPLPLHAVLSVCVNH